MAGFPSTFGLRALVCPLMKAWSLLLLLAAPIEAHVRLNYIDGSDQPIRNANSATGNGRASVAGGPPRFKRIASKRPLGGSLLSYDAGQGCLRS